MIQYPTNLTGETMAIKRILELQARKHKYSLKETLNAILYINKLVVSGIYFHLTPLIGKPSITI